MQNHMTNNMGWEQYEEPKCYISAKQRNYFVSEHQMTFMGYTWVR